MTQSISITDFSSLLGTELGASEWVHITQDIVDQFAELAGDDQWIHTDVKKAKSDSPYGATIVHGYLILAFAPSLMDQVFTLTDTKMGVNRGFNKLRFVSPLMVGDQMRLKVELIEVEERQEYCEAVIKLTFEGYDYPKPVCVAELVKRWCKGT